MDNQFKTTDLSTDLLNFNMNDFDLDSSYTKCNLLYKLDVNFTSWGIWSISASVPDQTITVKITLNSKDNDNEISCELDLDLKDIVVNSDLENHKSLSDSIQPVRLELRNINLTNTNINSLQGTATGILYFS